jgi:hypothetical protein
MEDHINCNCRLCKATKNIIKDLKMLEDFNEFRQVISSLIFKMMDNNTALAIGFLEEMKMNFFMNNINIKEFFKYAKTELDKEKR